MFSYSNAVCALLVLSLFHKASSVPTIVLKTHEYIRNSGSQNGSLVNGVDRYVLNYEVARASADATDYPENLFSVSVQRAGQLIAVPITGCTPSLQDCSSSNQGCSCTQKVSDITGDTYYVVINTTANIKDSGGKFIAQWQSTALGVLVKTEFNLPDVCNQKQATYTSGSDAKKELSATGNNTAQISKDKTNTTLMFCVENLKSTYTLTIQLDGTNRIQGTTSCVNTTVVQADVGKVFTLDFTESTTEPGCGRQGSFTLVYEAVDTGSDSDSDTGKIVGITFGVLTVLVLCVVGGFVAAAKFGPSLTPTAGSKMVTRKLRFFRVEKTCLIITTNRNPKKVDWSLENGKYKLTDKQGGTYDIEKSPDEHKKEEEPVTSLDMACLPDQTSVKMVVTYAILPSTWSTKEVMLPCASATNKDGTALPKPAPRPLPPRRLEPINNDMKTNGTEKNNKTKSHNTTRDAAGDKTDGLKEVEEGMEMSRVRDGGVGAAALTNEVMKENETKKKKKKRNRAKNPEGEELPPVKNAPPVQTVSPRPLPSPSGGGGVNTSVTGPNGISSHFSPQQLGRNRPTSIEVTRQGTN